MSNEESKVKHSKRIHDKETAIVRQTKIAKSHGLNVEEPHKFNKHHALDCGIPECPFCSSPRKIFNDETIQEKSFKQRKLHDE